MSIPQSATLTAPSSEGAVGVPAPEQNKTNKKEMQYGKTKNYDTYVSPGKRYLYKSRIVLFAFAIVLFVLNMIIIAGVDESMRGNAIIAIVLSALFGIGQFIDNRKVHWTWFYIIILCAMLLLFSAFAVFATELFFMRYVWQGELVFFCVLIPLLLRKKKG